MAGSLGKRIYLDANPIIYFFEAHASFGPLLRRFFEIAELRQITLVMSKMTLCEVLVLPLKLNQSAHVERYKSFLSGGPGLEMLPVDREILIEGARLRAAHGGKLPDAVHVATALNAGCAMFPSEDQSIRAPAGLTLVKVSELAGYIPQGTA